MALAKAKVDERIAKARVLETAPETATLHLPDTTPPAPAATDLPAVQPQPAAPPAAAPAPVVQPGVPAADASEFHARGRKLLQEEHFAEAIQQLTEAVRLDPALALAFNARGYSYYRLKQYPQAIADFDRAISLNPGYANAYQNRGAARGAAGDKAGSAADQAKARELTRTAANR
jgi:tetratricopeptide (TPR) repeat protein